MEIIKRAITRVQQIMRGFGSLLTKFYLSKVVQRGTMKHGANPHYC